VATVSDAAADDDRTSGDGADKPATGMNGTDGTNDGAVLAARFDDLCALFIGEPGVTPPSGGRGFGRSALRWHGRIFAMLVRGSLVVKLPAAQVDTLVAAGRGVRFDANKGTPMKEWCALDTVVCDDADWESLAHEALTFAQTKG
jgi:hypothetical protein